MGLGELDKAWSAGSEAAAIQDQLARDHPDVDTYTMDLVLGLGTHAMLLDKAGDRESSRSFQIRSRDILGDFAGARPQYARLHGTLASCLHNLSQIDAEIGNLESAVQFGRDALARMDYTVNRVPDDPEMVTLRKRVAENLATLLVDFRRYGEALEALPKLFDIHAVLHDSETFANIAKRAVDAADDRERSEILQSAAQALAAAIADGRLDLYTLIDTPAGVALLDMLGFPEALESAQQAAR